MVNNIIGVGPQREVTPVRPAKDRARTTETTTATGQDGVAISPEAKLAAEIAKFAKASEQQSEIRQKAVEKARQDIMNGSYKVQQAVLGVAVKIQPYLQ